MSKHEKKGDKKEKKRKQKLKQKMNEKLDKQQENGNKDKDKCHKIDDKSRKLSNRRVKFSSKVTILSKSKAAASLEKAVNNVQQILKKKNAEVKNAKIVDESNTSLTTTKPLKKKRFRNRGLVYVGHIPHGFYEEQMEDYFKQFGKVTRVRVARSKRTGKSRGYGYVEFLHEEVAKIAAETMNNYLMCGRLLKATCIPPEKQHFGFFAGVNWSEAKYPKLKNRRKTTLHRNKHQSAENHVRDVKRSLNKIATLESKLQDKGINIKFRFAPVS